VVAAHTLATSVFRDPTPEGYPEPDRVPLDQMLASHLVPQLALRLKELGLEPAPSARLTEPQPVSRTSH
jgi:hypothetical protein